MVCGVNVGLGSFSLPDSQGNWKGLDVDMCSALAAAALGDAGKTKFVPLSAQQRSVALHSGEIDVLVAIRPSRWSATLRSASNMPASILRRPRLHGWQEARR